MQLFVATKNSGKLREMRASFDEFGFELDSYDGYADVAENAASYVGNAVLKARALAAQLRERGVIGPVLADDSGLEVEALGDRPGVLSARYAGPESSWSARRSHLLAELAGVSPLQRRARFVCVMAALLPGRELLTSIGAVEGFITERESGEGGFGYDSVFFFPPCGCTFAALSEARKNSMSHRRRAAEAMVAAIHRDV